MAMINSVLGPLDTAKLGFTLMHEHIMLASAGFFRNLPELYGANAVDKMVNNVKMAKAGGVDTIVDATTLDLDRDVNLLAEVSRRSGVNIIACTGWWLNIPFLFTRGGLSPDQLAGVFIREIERGIAGSNIKAGILKSASDMAGVTPEAELVLRAVARAHLKTGVPIMLHSYPASQVARQQLAILRNEGVNLKRVKVDHSLDTTDVEYLTWILEQGCYLGLERYPGHNASPLARTKTIKALIDAGYADRLCPAHDWQLGYVVAAKIPEMTEEGRQRINPHDFLYLKKVVFPQLREMGVPEATINKLCVVGPRNFFEGV